LEHELAEAMVNIRKLEIKVRGPRELGSVTDAAVAIAQVEKLTLAHKRAQEAYAEI
jgi:hypothetical protein